MSNESNERPRLSTVEALNQAAKHVEEAVKVLRLCPSPDPTLLAESSAFDATVVASRELRDAIRALLTELDRIVNLLTRLREKTP